MSSIIAEIDRFTFILAPIFYRLLYISIISTVIGSVIIVIRKFLDSKISPKWISTFWILFILTLIVPAKIESQFSIYNYVLTNDIILNREFEKLPNGLYRDRYNLAKHEKEVYSQLNIIDENKVLELEKRVNQTYIKLLIADVIIPCAWFISMIILTIMYTVSHLIFSKKIKYDKIKDARLLKILDNCKKELDIDRKIKIIVQKHIKTPSIFGVFNIRILLNEKINQMSDNEIRYIFMHELGHYKRKDNILNIAIIGIKIIYCFNPIIWALCGEVRRDMELATDQIVADRMDSEQQKDYCKTLLNLSYINNKNSMVNALCLSNDKNNLTKRITAIKLSGSFKKNKNVVRVLGMLVIALVTLFLYTSKIPNNIMRCGIDKCNCIYIN